MFNDEIFIIQHPSFIIHPSSFILHHSSFILASILASDSP
jgi:hypothetical protein